MRITIISVLFLSFFSCNTANQEIQSVPEKKEKKSLKERLETRDGDFLMRPLEESWDNLAEATLYDPRLSDTTYNLETEHYSGKAQVKAQNGRTVYLKLNLNSETATENHEWFSDRDGNLFKSQHEFIYHHYGVDESSSRQEFKFYFDDDGSMVSSYSKKSFIDQKHPSKWTAHELTPNELTFIWSRKQFLKASSSL